MVVVIEKLRLQNKLVVTTTSPLKDAKNTAQAIYTIAFLNNLTFTMYLKHKAEDNTKQKKKQEFLCAVCSEDCILQIIQLRKNGKIRRSDIHSDMSAFKFLKIEPFNTIFP